MTTGDVILLPGGLRAVGHDELLVLAGETASGKTALAVSLAKQHGGEIVGADSVQVHRRFDIGSGKPTAAELDGVPHHLLDVADAKHPIDAGRFVELADAAIADVRARGRVPIVCGGTYLWIKALLFGLAAAPSAPPELRASLQEEAARLGSPALHARLAEVDAATAARLHPNDAVRIVRALEVQATTGRTLSSWQAEHGFREVRHRARLVALARPRQELEERIALRVDRMLTAGLVEETRVLVDDGYAETRPMKAVGYAEATAHLRGELDAASLAPKITRATRIVARRQRTWLKGANVEWIPTTG
ncbi:MAG: tRNA (adenosine(37)-N6)-dimethylallyltransferase MiaA [Polyangiales bacterium]